jgi:hypothetical protein
VPWYRRNWFAILSAFTCVPIAGIIAATGPIYYVRRGELRKYSPLAQAFIIVWSFSNTAGILLHLAKDDGATSATAPAISGSAEVTAIAPSSSAAAPEPAAEEPCPSTEELIVGAWTSGTLHESYLADGTYVLNGTLGRYTFVEPGLAHLTSGSLEGIYRFAFVGPDELVAVSTEGSAVFYHRIGAGRGVPAHCLDVHRQIVGTWAGGSFVETYGADGSYALNGVAGTYSWTSADRAVLVIGARAAIYRFGMTTSDELVAASSEGAVTIYHRIR